MIAGALALYKITVREDSCIEVLDTALLLLYVSLNTGKTRFMTRS